MALDGRGKDVMYMGTFGGSQHQRAGGGAFTEHSELEGLPTA